MSTPASRSRCDLADRHAVHALHHDHVRVQSPRPSRAPARRSSPAMLRRSCAALAASRTRSSSSCRYLSNSATTSRGFRRLPSADRRSTQPRHRAHQRQVVVDRRRSMPGRSTLTATLACRPCSIAKCTWAIDALATGSRSKLREDRRRCGRPKARSTIARSRRSAGNGGTRSCSRASSSAMSGGSRSRRVDSTWPNLTKIGPRRSSA